jgi:hypothetical protein
LSGVETGDLPPDVLLAFVAAFEMGETRRGGEVFTLRRAAGGGVLKPDPLSGVDEGALPPGVLFAFMAAFEMGEVRRGGEVLITALGMRD